LTKKVLQKGGKSGIFVAGGLGKKKREEQNVGAGQKGGEDLSREAVTSEKKNIKGKEKKPVGGRVKRGKEKRKFARVGGKKSEKRGR